MTVHAPIGEDTATSNMFATVFDSVGDKVVAVVSETVAVSGVEGVPVSSIVGESSVAVVDPAVDVMTCAHTVKLCIETDESENHLISSPLATNVPCGLLEPVYQ